MYAHSTLACAHTRARTHTHTHTHTHTQHTHTHKHTHTPHPAQVLDLLGEKVECVRYSQWVLHPPESSPFPVIADREAYTAAIERAAGPKVRALLE